MQTFPIIILIKFNKINVEQMIAFNSNISFNTQQSYPLFGKNYSNYLHNISTKWQTICIVRNIFNSPVSRWMIRKNISERHESMFWLEFPLFLFPAVAYMYWQAPRFVFWNHAEILTLEYFKFGKIILKCKKLEIFPEPFKQNF